MNSYQFYDQELNADNLEAACLQAVEGNPMVPMSVYPMGGDQWLCELIDALEDHPLSDELSKVLERLFNSLPITKIEVLASVAESRAAYISGSVLIEVFSRSEDASDATKSSLARVICEELLEGGLVYQKELRVHALEACKRDWLSPAYLCFDHKWTLQQLPQWFDTDVAAKQKLIGSMLSPLTIRELKSFQKEVSAADSNLSPATQKMIIEAASHKCTLPFVKNRGDTVRWEN
ncbi:MAG: hypothetical protein ACI934_001376 [Pseudohongiellaceae bacterium]|jgi:hypothetical protein